MKKKLIGILAAGMLSAALCVPVSAAYVSTGEALTEMEALSFMRGTGDGMEADRAPTRAEAAVLQLRLAGLEEAASQAGLTGRFLDGGWADAYLSYASSIGFVQGVSENLFESDRLVSARDYVTMTLRLLGYIEGEDFTWQGSLVFADGLGLTHGEYSASPEEPFLREDMASVSYSALTLRPKDGERTLIETLYLEGKVQEEELRGTRLAWALNAGKPVYDSRDIYSLCSSAVFYTECYDTAEDLTQNRSSSHGSGFFITEDGLALMSYHQLEDVDYARVRTNEGRTYDITGVLCYDPLWDAALVRVSRWDTEGVETRRFPCLTLGDSDTLTGGERIYTLSSPLGMEDSISDGVVSNRKRLVDDPDYLCIQYTAPISRGSSGGALVNSYGEAVGIIFAMFENGQNLNLAVPISSLGDLPLEGDGLPLAEVHRIEAGKKAAATLWASETDIVLTEGEWAEILVSHDCPGHADMVFTLDNPSTADCAWGEFVTKRSVPIWIQGKVPGETELRVNFLWGSGNPEAELLIHITVIAAAG